MSDGRQPPTSCRRRVVVTKLSRRTSMEGKDVAQLITAIAAPLMAGLRVHQLGRRLTFQRAAMDTFHRLVHNVNDLRLALIANQSHSLNGAKVLAGYDAIDKMLNDANRPKDRDEAKVYNRIREK